jgi:hypothetical protein
MFDTLSDKFEQTVKRLRGHGKITERNIEDAVRDVRVALLEADVHFEVVKDFTERVRQQALGQEVLRSLTPEQHFIKIVRAELTQLMGGAATELSLSATPPVVIADGGAQGAGKTTTVGKLARASSRPSASAGRFSFRRRLPSRRHRAAHHAGQAGRCSRLSDASRRDPFVSVAMRSPMRATMARCGADRHRRTPAHRRRAHDRARAHS